ncbi:MAG: DUF2793 domain-containing protein [Devosia sp.]|nr:DUF2793 domain-containing protein [Devosia sp.]
MDETANLGLAYIMPAQAQKYVTHNEALRDLDSLVQLSVRDRDLAAPPVSPAAGDRYLIAASPTGAWSGHAGAIAAWQDGAWLFYGPQEGWRVWVIDESLLIALSGGTWVLAGGQSINPAPMMGVLATADTTNRLSVKSNAVLFAYDDITPGTGDIRATFGKAAAVNTASLLFQDAYSGRAEIGLAGDDHFHLKVSADGSSWNEAMHVDNATARVGVGTTAPTSRLTASDNTGPLPAATSGTVGHFVGADTASCRVIVDAIGSGSPVIQTRRARGTAAAPSAVQSGDQILNVASFGYGTTTYSSTRAGFVAVAAQNWTDTAQGTSFQINTSANGTALAVTGLLLDQDGSVKFARIGTTASAANAFLDSAASNSLLRSTSSLAYKTDVEPLRAQYAHALMAAEPIWYRSTAPADNPAWSWYGFGAEPVAAIDPRMVHWGYSDGDYELVPGDDPDRPASLHLKAGAVASPQGVAYDRFVAHHHLIIRELLDRVAKLEALQATAQSK